MKALTSGQWTPIYMGEIDNRKQGSRPVRIEKGGGSKLRVVTTTISSGDSIAISGETPLQLEERLVVYGKFTDAQAREIVRKALFRDS